MDFLTSPVFDNPKVKPFFDLTSSSLRVYTVTNSSYFLHISTWLRAN